ncbi:MAG TPA: tryptophan 7-halogenase, partial [Thermoanaerobaculia bacterium]
MSGQTIDVCIVGGGPAGTAAALTLRRYSDLSVAVVERSAYDTVRYGETVPPTLQPLLRYLGVWEPFLAQRHLPAFGTSASWGGPRLSSR